jgi:hypothetical protein
MSKTDKTLGDVIQGALKRAAGEQSTEECGCMHCADGLVNVQTIKSKRMTVSLAQGEGTNGEEELELTFSFPPADDDSVIRVVGDEEVAEFYEIMRGFFA